MVNTVMTAKNSFAEGLIMDFAPDNTQANCMTSALNATLLTFNGNEMSLQNDMGNGRVETAFLPEGYVPVGTCEFGDIIYIVSYNPLINKSQIGCFPSPERNISSKELGLASQSVSNSDFQESGGKLKTTSIKKIIYNKNMNPGDKYIIYGSNIDDNQNELSDYNNILHTHGDFPKMVKIHVVAIEDSGKINYLDSSVKWYDNDYYICNSTNISAIDPDIDEYRDLVTSTYSIFQSKVSGKLALLIELERIDTFDCSYSVRSGAIINNKKTYTVKFNSSWDTKNKNVNPKGIIITESNWPNAVSNTIPYITANGKLESNITDYTNSHVEFSRVYKIENPDINNTYETAVQNLIKNIQGGDTSEPNKYPQTLLFKEEGFPNTYFVNPHNYKNKQYYTQLSDGSEILSEIREISDDLVNNFFHKEVTKSIVEVEIPVTSKKDGDDTVYYNDISKFVWNYTVAPYMPYGILDDLSISGSIDFSKIGSGLIDLSEWRYYNDGNISTLKWGLEAYPEDNKKISKVVFEFHDDQGAVATYLVKDKVSYSGSFTESIQLGPEGSNPNLSIYDINGELIKHKGEAYEATEPITEDLGDAYITETEEGKTIYYLNDVGVLYPNIVYLVKIYVYTAEIDNYGNIISENDEPKIFYRWYWTNNLMNSYYYNTLDFIGIQPELTYNLNTSFRSNDSFKLLIPESDPDNLIINNHGVTMEEGLSSDEIAKNSLGGMIKKVISTAYNEEKPEVLDNTENIYLNITPCLDDSYNTFQFDIDKLKEHLKYEVYFPEEEKIEYTNYDLIFSDQYMGEINAVKPEQSTQLKDEFQLIAAYNSPKGNKTIQYQTLDGELSETTNSNYYEINAADALYYQEYNKGFPLLLKGNMISRIAGTIYNNKEIDATIYRPAIQNVDDLLSYNMDYTNSTVYFLNCLAVGPNGDNDITVQLRTASCDKADPNNRQPVNYGEYFLGRPEGLWSEKNPKEVSFEKITKQESVNVGPYGMLTFYASCGDDDIDDFDSDTDEDSMDGHICLQNYSGKPQTINYLWRNTWQDKVQGGKQYQLRYPFKHEYYPNGGLMTWPSGYKHTRRSLNAFIAKTKDDRYIIFNNLHSSSTSVNSVSQRFGKDIYDDNIRTCAQLLLSVLAKIYYKSENTEKEIIPMVTNIVTCSDYDAIWKKNLVVKTVYDVNNTQTNVLLSMSNLNYADYIGRIQKPDNIVLNNINIIINTEKVCTTQFQYTLPYDIDYLLKLYSTENIKYLIESDITGEFKRTPVGEPPFSGTFGVLQNIETEEETTWKVRPFLNTLEFPCITIKNGLFKNSEKHTINIPKQIQQNLVLEDGIIQLGAIQSQPQYRIRMFSGNSGDTSDNKGGEQAWLQFDKAMVFFDEEKFKIL